jgi:hypothetical protein
VRWNLWTTTGYEQVSGIEDTVDGIYYICFTEAYFTTCCSYGKAAAKCITCLQESRLKVIEYGTLVRQVLRRHE